MTVYIAPFSRELVNAEGEIKDRDFFKEYAMGLGEIMDISTFETDWNKGDIEFSTEHHLLLID